MRTFTLSLFTLLSLLFVAAPASADRWDNKGWVKLGERRVNGTADRDTIVVGRDDGKFTKLTIVVENSALDLTGFTVTFGNGDKWQPPGTVGYQFRPTSFTRVIDLPGNTRIIKRIDLRYRNVGKWRDANIEVWGWRAGDAAPTKEERDARKEAKTTFKFDATGWQLLGERTVDRGGDHDRIDVGGYKGKFSKIAVVVYDNDIELNDLEIKFGRGAPWRPGLRHHFKEGAQSRIIDFPGDDRVLKHIDFRYKTVTRGTKARVQVWAK
jgi:hypothetical protein